MKKLLLFISATCATMATFAQDYYPVKKNDVYYYTNDTFGDAFPLKIDSVKLEGKDSIYFLYKQVRKVAFGTCNYTSLGDSWIGDSIRVKENGSCIFVNKFKKPFLLKTFAKPNEKWIAFESSKWKAEITVSAITKETLLGITDSVKTFVINILKINGDDTTSSYDGMEIRLTKKSGLVKLLNFYAFGLDFSKNEGDYLTSSLNNLTYSGSQNLKDGMYNITSKEIYDYEVGDVFHIRSFYNGGPNGGSTQTLLSYSVISKKISAIEPDNKTGYMYEILRKSEFKSGGLITFSLDTIIDEYIHNEFIELPITFRSTDQSWGTTKIYRSTVNTRLAKTIVGDIFTGTGYCLNQIIDGGGCYSDYIQGLGGPYYSCMGQMTLSSYGRTLEYYKKGNEEWGVPLILGTSEGETFPFQITVSPNPASGFVNFDLGKISNGVKIDLMDNSGKIVYSETAFGFAKIDASSFKKGMYFYSISADNNKRLTGKLIVE